MKRRYHLRVPFFAYCGMTILIVVAALNGGSNLLFWVAGTMASALLISGALSGLMLVRLETRRLIPTHGAVGEPLSIRYVVRNRSRLLPAFNLHVDERPVAGPHGWSRALDPRPAWILHVGPGERVHGEATFRPSRRGEAWFDELRIRTSFPFGVIGKSVTFSQPQRTLVYPRHYAVRRDVLDAIAPAASVGMKITQHAGAGDDFYGLREFRPGDSLRHIAWKRTANRDQLLCVERTRPNPPRLRVALNLAAAAPADAPGGTAALRVWEEHAITLVASLLCAADRVGYEVGLTILGVAAASIPVRRGPWHRNELMAALAEIDLDASRVARRPPAIGPEDRAGLVVVHPDRIDLRVAHDDAWHFSARQMPHLLDLPATHPLRTGEAARAGAAAAETAA